MRAVSLVSGLQWVEIQSGARWVIRALKWYLVPDIYKIQGK